MKRKDKLCAQVPVSYMRVKDTSQSKMRVVNSETPNFVTLSHLALFRVSFCVILVKVYGFYTELLSCQLI